MLKKILFFSFIVVLFVGVFILKKSNYLPAKLEGQEIVNMKPQKKLSDAKIVGWVAYWDEKNTLSAFPAAANRLTIFTPVLYRINEDGTLGKYTVLYKKDFLDMAKAKNIPIMPQIGDDFDFERVSLLLHDREVQDKFIESLVDEAKKEEFIGWDIDIESLKRSDKDAFSMLIENMAETLHQNSLKLSITVFARTAKDKNEAATAQDYRRIGEAADEVRLMVYGAHDDESQPGGQAPLSWMRDVLSYATKNIPTEKITVGLSTHGYDWDNEKGEPLTFPQIQARIGEATPSVKFDEKVSSAIYRYRKDGQNREIWFENARAITEKMLIALNEFNIDKFAIWRIGAEDPQIWDKLKE